MTEFEASVPSEVTEALASASLEEQGVASAIAPPRMLRMEDALDVLYCPHCTMPPEYCMYGVDFEEKCLPWILDNCPDVLDAATLDKLIGDEGAEGEDGEKKKSKRGGIGIKKKKASQVETKVIIARIQRQKRKFVTAIAGLETVPGAILLNIISVITYEANACNDYLFYVMIMVDLQS